MSDERPSPEFEELLRRAVTAPNPEPAFVKDLQMRLSAEAKRLPGASRGARARLAWAAALVVVVLAVGLLVVSPRGAAAMRRLLAYIPGLGLVERSTPVRLLEQPAVVRRLGIVVTVEKGVADAEKTVLLVRVEGLQPSLDPLRDEIPDCEGTPQLRTSRGEIAVEGSEGYGWESGYTQRMVFPALPLEENQVLLSMPCLLQLVPGEWATGWEIPLSFVTAADTQFVPVIELPGSPTPATPQAAQTSEAGQPAPVSGAAAPDFGISLSVDRYVELEDGYILMGSLHWTQAQVGYGFLGWPVTITDAGGLQVPYEQVSPDEWPSPEEQRTAWAYQIEGKQHSWPLTLEVEGVIVDLSLAEPVTFTFDPGPRPQVGQTWDLDLEVPVEGFLLQIHSARAVQDTHGGNAVGYEFEIQADGGVVGALVMDPAQQAPGGGGGGGGGGAPGAGPFTASVLYAGEALPPGPLTLAIANLTTVSRGPWQVTWAPSGQ